MRPVIVTLNAAGFSQWIPIDYVESWFGVSALVMPSEDAISAGGLAYVVQYSPDSPNLESTLQTPILISRAAAVATVTDAGPRGLGHGLSTGDNVIISGTNSPLVLDSQPAQWGPGQVGWQIASTPSPTTYTYAVANSGPTADQGTTQVVRMRVFPAIQSTGTGGTRGTFTFNYPVRAIRLGLTTITAGFVDMITLQGTSK